MRLSHGLVAALCFFFTPERKPVIITGKGPVGKVFAFILPREQLVEPAGCIALELGIDVVLNKSVPTEQILAAAECKHLGLTLL